MESYAVFENGQKINLTTSISSFYYRDKIRLSYFGFHKLMKFIYVNPNIEVVECLHHIDIINFNELDLNKIELIYW